MAEEVAVLAGGCFWCTEAVFLDVVGVKSVESGYTGGQAANPTYKQVCGGDTGHAEAIRILDAFWPRWLRAQFEPSLGAPLYEQLTGAHEVDNTPNGHGDHLGSAYQNGWYGYAYKDLRRVLGLKVRAPYGKRYCGGGRRTRCARSRMMRNPTCSAASFARASGSKPRPSSRTTK